MNPEYKDIKILIVDDEYIIRERLRYNLESENYNVCGLAEDGDEAFEMIGETSPDIVISDIAMPNLSGTELIEKCRQNGIGCRFIFLTGYSDVNFAITALRNKASDYLMKPINRDELLRSIEKECDSILAERKRQKDTYRLALELYRFLLGDDRKVSNELKSLIENESYNKFALIWGGPVDTQILEGFPSFLLSNDEWFVFMKSGMYPELERLDERCRYVISDEYRGRKELVSCFTRCRLSLLQRFFSLNRVFSQTESQMDKPLLDSFLIFNHEKLRNGIYSDYRKVMTDQISRLRTPKELDYYTYSMLALFKSHASDMDDKSWTGYSPLWIIERFSRIDKYTEWMIKLFENIFINESDARSLPLCTRVKRFLDMNYNRSELTLDDIALANFASSNYICTRFKEEEHMTVFEYLANLRLSKAYELVRDTSMDINKVATTVGFNDALYFSKCFKKKYGITPKSLRKG